jgi:hypothetical protein
LVQAGGFGIEKDGAHEAAGGKGWLAGKDSAAGWLRQTQRRGCGRGANAPTSQGNCASSRKLAW